MGLRARLQRLEQQARGNLVSFELLDGSRFYYDPQTMELFLHWYDCLMAGNPDKWPEPPEAVRKVTEARDPPGGTREPQGRSLVGHNPLRRGGAHNRAGNQATQPGGG